MRSICIVFYCFEKKLFYKTKLFEMLISYIRGFETDNHFDGFLFVSFWSSLLWNYDINYILRKSVLLLNFFNVCFLHKIFNKKIPIYFNYGELIDFAVIYKKKQAFDDNFQFLLFFDCKQ